MNPAGGNISTLFFEAEKYNCKKLLTEQPKWTLQVEILAHFFSKQKNIIAKNSWQNNENEPCKWKY